VLTEVINPIDIPNKRIPKCVARNRSRGVRLDSLVYFAEDGSDKNSTNLGNSNNTSDKRVNLGTCSILSVNYAKYTCQRGILTTLRTPKPNTLRPTALGYPRTIQDSGLVELSPLKSLQAPFQYCLPFQRSVQVMLVPGSDRPVISRFE
jgi:hypothetical protein